MQSYHFGLVSYNPLADPGGGGGGGGGGEGGEEGCNLIPFGPTMNNVACCVIFSSMCSCTHCSYYTLKALASRALHQTPLRGLRALSIPPRRGGGAPLSLGGGATFFIIH